MARKPVYRLHRASNQARTTFNGKRIYLDVYDSPESHQLFEEIIARWEAAEARRKAPAASLTIGRLAILFLKHAEKFHRRNTLNSCSSAESAPYTGSRSSRA